MKTIILAFGIFLFLGNTARAQAVSIGAIGGVPFTDSTNNGFGRDESRPYVVGASIEVRLPAGFAIEADGIYQPIGTTASFQLADILGPGFNLSSAAVTSSSTRTRGNSWQLPVLGKYYFRPRESGWQPFVATGWALRTIGFHNEGSETFVDASGTSQTNSFRYTSRSDFVGAVVAAGVRIRAGRFAFLPEVRYTRWGGSDLTVSKNEAGLLLGITF
jgi:Outer membrane protein beta-barrel domain